MLPVPAPVATLTRWTCLRIIMILEAVLSGETVPGEKLVQDETTNQEEIYSNAATSKLPHPDYGFIPYRSETWSKGWLDLCPCGSQRTVLAGGPLFEGWTSG